MAETLMSQVTITLGRSGQVVKRVGDELDSAFSNSHPTGGCKRSIRDRLGTNVEFNNKRIATMQGGFRAILSHGSFLKNAILQRARLVNQVHFIAAACENMISGTGMRPGDIITASNGKTIESIVKTSTWMESQLHVNNTDAEGRLTLADALVYACNQGVDKIVDFATLTGACVVALGPSIAASEVAGEKLWRLPLEKSYWDSMNLELADMVNTGGRQGCSITAALFLKQQEIYMSNLNFLEENDEEVDLT